MNPSKDHQKGYFNSLLANTRLVDVEHVNLSPTWRNFRIRNEEVDKRMDRFMVSEALMQTRFGFKLMVEVGGKSYHRLITLQWSPSLNSPPAPLKIKLLWLEDEDFRKMVLSSWEKLTYQKPEPMMIQFATSLQNLKESIKTWLPIWKARRL
jgi:hypothetical protein